MSDRSTKKLVREGRTTRTLLGYQRWTCASSKTKATGHRTCLPRTRSNWTMSETHCERGTYSGRANSPAASTGSRRWKPDHEVLRAGRVAMLGGIRLRLVTTRWFNVVLCVPSACPVWAKES